MRDRLIELFKQADEKAGEYIRENDHMDFIPTKDELAGVYADHFLANGVIVPPCKVGDKVYHLQRVLDDATLLIKVVIKTRKVDFVSATNSKYMIEADGFIFDKNDFGKTVFLAREEAEQALKGGEG